MNRNAVISVILFYLGVSIFFSCSKDESDNIPPTIEGILRPIPDTTIMTDTLCPFVAKFFDNDSTLSSYSIRVWNAQLNSSKDTTSLKKKDPNDTNSKDSAFFNSAFQEISIFGEKEVLLNLASAYKVDSTLNVRGKSYPTSLGKHYIKLSVIDIYGNLAEDSMLINVKRYTKPEGRSN
ncbi:MAG: hypothetical protein E6772_02920 [Dysgonomonas sp.]|nr:hypothetical protein [Dysgonomonas sp.]